MQTKMPTPKEQKLIQKIKRRDFYLVCLSKVGIYVAVILGVMLTEAILDVEDAGQVVFQFSWIRLGAAALIAGFSMSRFESGGDPRGKNKNMGRRLSHAFSQGAALRGIIEGFYLLFAFTR